MLELAVPPLQLAGDVALLASEVAHADGFTSRVVDQSRISDAWVSLGTYRFDGAGDAYVSLSDVTGERRLGYRIGFDAVRWTRR